MKKQVVSEEIQSPIYLQVEEFVKKQGHASCYEIMNKFSVTYSQSVKLMDELERKEVVQFFLKDDNGDSIPENGPRKLMTSSFKKQAIKHEEDRVQRVKNRAEEEARIKPVTPIIVEKSKPDTAGKSVRRKR